MSGVIMEDIEYHQEDEEPEEVPFEEATYQGCGEDERFGGEAVDNEDDGARNATMVMG